MPSSKPIIAKNIGFNVDSNNKQIIPNALSDTASNKLPKNDCTFNFLARNPSIKSVTKKPAAARAVTKEPHCKNIGIIATVPSERIPVIRFTNILLRL